jgi:hypothetical protein
MSNISQLLIDPTIITQGDITLLRTILTYQKRQEEILAAAHKALYDEWKAGLQHAEISFHPFEKDVVEYAKTITTLMDNEHSLHPASSFSKHLGQCPFLREGDNYTATPVDLMCCKEDEPLKLFMRIPSNSPTTVFRWNTVNEATIAISPLVHTDKKWEPRDPDYKGVTPGIYFMPGVSVQRLTPVSTV